MSSEPAQYTQESMLTRDGKPDGSIVSRNLQEELTSTFGTQEQIDRALLLIRSKEAGNVADAKRIMMKEDASNHTNDAWSRE